jgi:hypothetical protein
MATEQEREDEVRNAGIAAGIDAVFRLGPDLPRDRILEEARHFVSLSPYEGTPSAAGVLMTFATSYQIAAYKIRNKGAEPELDTDGAYRAGENAIYVYGPDLSRDQLMAEARRVYSFEAESSMFYFGYCAAERAVKEGSIPGQPRDR